MMVLLSSASAYSTCAIAVDRYVCISRPLRYNLILSDRRVNAVLAYIWFLSAVFACVPLIVRNVSMDELSRGRPLCLLTNVHNCCVAIVFVIVFIPTVIVIVTNFRIFTWTKLHLESERGVHRGNKKMTEWEKWLSIEANPPFELEKKHKKKKHVTIAEVTPVKDYYSIVVSALGRSVDTGASITCEDDVKHLRKAMTERHWEDELLKPASPLATPTGTTSYGSMPELTCGESSVDPVPPPVIRSVLKKRESFSCPEKLDNLHSNIDSTKLVRIALFGSQIDLTERTRRGRRRSRRRRRGSGLCLPRALGEFCGYFLVCRGCRAPCTCVTGRPEVKAALVLLGIVLSFVVTWTPFGVVVVLHSGGIVEVPSSLRLLSLWLAYLNSCVNPFVYFIFNIVLRRTVSTYFTLYREGYVRHADPSTSKADSNLQTQSQPSGQLSPTAQPTPGDASRDASRVVSRDASRNDSLRSMEALAPSLNDGGVSVTDGT
ncbi:D(2) dopamine receptor B [Aplysia californica]|uniref:D(2) dopamine receptor B n=1 Tax=Aplysia californica TaxID=6500 RepID=A0ABM1A4I8_APLCA|nr:D(2) dopamine receptor B [Aplysia californica]